MYIVGLIASLTELVIFDLISLWYSEYIIFVELIENSFCVINIVFLTEFEIYSVLELFDNNSVG